ncbi:hypothetical protein OTU49_002610 [Cherax quadricarinatus]|uniref:Actin maturation protease n=1 Tax=Cherax quadricarinatus TaxID=27406 RepID=A0AAW0XNJ6_CHEQU
MWVAGGGPADIVTAASTATASHTPLLVPPTPPPRRFLGENNKSSKTPSETLRSIVILESETTPSMFMPTSTPQPAAKVPAAHSQFMPDLSSSATSSSALSPHSPTSLNKNISASPVPSTSLTSSAPLPPRPPSPKPGASGVTKSPLITTSPYGKIVIIRSDLPLPPPEEEIRSTFANIKDWGILEEEVDTLSIYTQLRPVIQQGPQCGIVALSMASQVFPETVEVPDLLQAAKKQGYSCHGEMFSCDAMTKLAGNINGMEATVCRDVLCNPRRVLELIMQGDLILVPYDAERNYMPGLRSGHKAHWGVICGCLVQCQSLNMYMGGASKLDSHVDNLWHLRPRSRVCIAHLPKTRDGSVTPVIPVVSGSPNIGCPSLRPLEQPATDDDSDICKLGEKSKEGSVIRSSEVDSWSVSNSRVNTPMLPEHLQDEIKLIPLWRQGKSRKLVASSLEQLRESNDQLVEYPPATTVQEEEYIIESVQDGLAGQVVVLHKTKTALSDLVGLLQETKSC